MKKPVRFSQEIFDKVCELIAEGDSLRTICKRPEMPGAFAVRKWINEDEVRGGSLSKQYARARDEQADFYADVMDDIAKDETIDINRARLIIDTRKWVASKLKPRRYGDKLDMTSDGSKLENIVIIKTTANSIISTKPELIDGVSDTTNKTISEPKS